MMFERSSWVSGRPEAKHQGALSQATPATEERGAGGGSRGRSRREGEGG